MSLDGHIRELQRKHDDLDQQISQALRMPSADNLHIQRMKKEKLRLKDEIARMRRQ